MNLSTLYKKLTNGKHTIQNKLLISLFVGIIGIINFGYCLTINTVEIQSSNVGGLYHMTGADVTCVENINCGYLYFNFDGGGTANSISSDQLGDISVGYCGYSEYVGYSSRSTCDIRVIGMYNLNYSQSMCEEEYSLIPISTIDTNYCVGNGYCPNECGSGGEITGTNRSSLYINNIQYPGAPTIKFTIPEEIQREQNTDEEETNIDVIGYGYDQNKMQQMVNTQYYKPTAEEMSGLMEKVADFLPLVAIALLITRIRRVIKKVF